ncbi:type VII secretion protein EccB [Nocardia sp. NPDC049220]|uniref:type VII secretion protein EccB n=1 Tax=Nocardia sp. NPDC049220 TaxID=3155273 RepID=UPI0033C088FF
MPAQLTTRAQVNGYRFLLKRIQHALVRRDVRMLHDPMRAQFRSMVVGAVLATLAVAGCAILGLLKPQGAVRDAKIIVGKDSGALFVVRDDALHPALNLASARLITGSAEKPTSVKESKLSSLPRGPMLGIPGAPSALPGPAVAGNRSAWSLCESTTVIAGVQRLVMAGDPELGDPIRPLAADEALLVSAGDKTYLLYDGKRAEIDLGNDAIVRSLQVQDIEARPIGAGLLNAAVAIPALAPPAIPEVGAPGKVPGTKVGSVLKVAGVSATELYVVVPAGIQRISPFAAEVIRNADSLGTSDIAAVPPDTLRGVPVVSTLPIDKFPTTRPRIVAADPLPVTCASWVQPDADHAATLTLLVGRDWPLPGSAKPAVSVGSGLDADHIDAAYIRPSSGEFVQVGGIEPGSVRLGSLYYIADTGIRYGIPDLATAEILGLGDRPKPAPWQIIGQLVPGPTLARPQALMAYDSVPGA